MNVTPARAAALNVLRAVRGGELADRALHGEFERLPARDRAWTQELVYGTLRLRGRLDFMLDRLVRGGTGRLEPDVLDVLRLGVYQLREMGSVPPYAAVSQSVELVKGAGGRGSGRLVNGVLRAVQRRGGEIPFPEFKEDPAAHLSTWGSHPRWLVERWVARFGAETARALIHANNRRPELYIRPVGLGPDTAREMLAADGVGARRVEGAPDALRILPPAGAREALNVVPSAIVQDPAAGLVVRYAAVPSGSMVADLCAAPGGKALGLAESAEYVAAADVSETRLRLLRENAKRLNGPTPVGLVAADARQPPFPDHRFDAVLVDVPCTGTGTLRRHPDGRWRIGPEALSSLIELQRAILDGAARLVGPGGLLIYATCSLEHEENEGQVEHFLNRNTEFEPALGAGAGGAAERSGGADVGTGGAGPAGRMIDDFGRLRILPHESGFDGAFAARMRRRPGS